jgi:hypothetical protein
MDSSHLRPAEDIIYPKACHGQALLDERLVPVGAHGPNLAEHALPESALVGQLCLGIHAHRLHLHHRQPPAKDVVDLLAAGLVPTLPHHVFPPEVQEVAPGRLTDPAFPAAASIAVCAADGSPRGRTLTMPLAPSIALRSLHILVCAWKLTDATGSNLLRPFLHGEQVTPPPKSAMVGLTMAALGGKLMVGVEVSLLLHSL